MSGKKKNQVVNPSTNWGGKRANSGRPSLGETIKVRELLDAHIDPAMVTEKLRELIENGDYRALDLYMKYRAGLPKQEMAIEMNATQDINFSLNNLVTFGNEEDED